MPVKVAINGFGRIGRLVLRAMIESGRDDLVPVAINDLGSTEANAHLFHYDSVHGRFPGQLEVSGDTITIRYGGRVWGPIKVSAERDPTKVPYQGVDVALECTGIFTSKEKASALITAGARKVLISAPGDHVDATIVYGVNHKVDHQGHDGDLQCVVHDELPGADGEGAARQLRHRARLHGHHPRLHRRPEHRRHAAQGPASRACRGGLGDPDLDWCGARGRAGDAGTEGQAGRHRDPHSDAERVAGVAGREPEEAGDQGQINAAMLDASKGALRGILDYNTEPLVSVDFNHCPASCTFDATQTAVVDGALARVMGWYDNEWGFSNRMSDTAALFGSL